MGVLMKFVFAGSKAHRSLQFSGAACDALPLRPETYPSPMVACFMYVSYSDMRHRILQSCCLPHYVIRAKTHLQYSTILTIVRRRREPWGRCF